ncbi:MAG TPA: hypothetical protein VMC85_08120 [Desulfomonilaceae bacterium]|nr:hypothetical protein [Desulfomonilaceae bacterium]
MEKRKISAKQAVEDIRSGMNDSALGDKYHLSPAGLQSLFDKLVTAGYIDLSEIQQRTPAFLGTVVVSETIPPAERDQTEDGRQPSQLKPASRVNAQEAARDIRSGMDDSYLMEKYKLSPKGLQSLINKLMAVGLIQQIDLDRRDLGFDHTVALSEDLLSISTAFQLLGVRQPDAPTDKMAAEAVEVAPAALVEKEVKEVKREAFSPNKQDAALDRAKEDKRAVERSWYDKPWLVILLLIAVFPLGLYACHRNSTLSTGIKAFAILVWILLAAGLIVIYFFDLPSLALI